MWRQRKLYDNLLLQTTHQVTGNGASNCVFFGKRDKDPKHVQRPLKAVVFDLDGTLTVPVLDFARMRRETGILHGDILVELEKMDTENRKRCEAIIERIEEEGHTQLQLQPGVLELFDWLRRSTSLYVGLVTRNTRKSTQFFIDWMIEKENWSKDFQPFDDILTRECTLPKPDPTCLFQISERAKCDPEEMMMIGDTVYDVECGVKAGTRTVLYAAPTWTEDHDAVVDELHPDYLISDMSYLIDILKQELQSNNDNNNGG